MDIKLLSNLEEVLENYKLELKNFNGEYTLLIDDLNLKWKLNNIDITFIFVITGKLIDTNNMISTLELLNEEINNIEPIIQYKLNNKTKFNLQNFHITKNHIKLIFTPYNLKINNSIVSYITTNCNLNFVTKTLKEKNIKLEDWIIDLSKLFVSKKLDIKKSLKNIIKFVKRYSIKNKKEAE